MLSGRVCAVPGPVLREGLTEKVALSKDGDEAGSRGHQERALEAGCACEVPKEPGPVWLELSEHGGWVPGRGDPVPPFLSFFFFSFLSFFFFGAAPTAHGVPRLEIRS